MRYQRVRLSNHMLMLLLTEGSEFHVHVKQGLPEGAKFCYSIPTTDYVYIDFVFEHPSFDVIMMGHEIPLFKEILMEKC